MQYKCGFIEMRDRKRSQHKKVVQIKHGDQDGVQEITAFSTNLEKVKKQNFFRLCEMIWKGVE